ncbi:hypothetical protein KUTeg_020375 [Tegillarca granosa]|uniref:Proline-rich transmembrane protein 3/4 domain-containing protein n=1 Tax=Tegillarca granosa TaxID=220873 RepID=A0ABQ9E7P8_TEGGR|nr:hypothetical protein KUTeg_020375 [Tegillarca granosa]
MVTESTTNQMTASHTSKSISNSDQIYDTEGSGVINEDNITLVQDKNSTIKNNSFDYKNLESLNITSKGNNSVYYESTTSLNNGVPSTSTPVHEPLTTAKSLLSEPVPEPEPTSYITSSPGSQSEPSTTSEPENNSTDTLVPNSSTTTSEPEPHSSSEPKPTANSTPDTETTAEFTPEPEQTAKTTQKSEPIGNSTAEPEAESTSEPEPTEPTGKSTAEPEPKSTSEPEPTGKSNSEPEPTGTSDPKSEPESTSEPESEPEPESEHAFAEPSPIWHLAKEEWRWGWEFLIYFFGVMFILLGLFSFISVIRLWRMNHLLTMKRQKALAQQTLSNNSNEKPKKTHKSKYTLSLSVKVTFLRSIVWFGMCIT